MTYSLCLISESRETLEFAFEPTSPPQFLVPPTAPASLAAKQVRGKVNLSWTASTDNVGVSGYKVWRNNVVIGQTASAGYTDSSVTAGQTYTYFVTAFDAAGNASGASNAVSVTVTGGKKK